MFTLTETFDDDCFEYEGQVLHVDMSFDNILRLFEMFDDETFYEIEKVPLALEILIDEYELIQAKPFEEQYALFEYVMKEFLGIDLHADGEKSKKIMDFKKDASLIYASFYAVYKMDLFQMQGKLHWRKFQALLTHLQDESPFKQVLGYRTMKIPDSKTTSEEYRNHVQKMKRIYALEQSEEEQTENINSAFDTVARAFKGVRSNE